jgi:hypothetical protein
MRRIALALALLLFGLAPAGAVERILLFVSDAVVARNGDLTVTETIRVEAEGREIRRGILRDFPTIYTGNDGARVEVGFDVQSVTRDGVPEASPPSRLPTACVCASAVPIASSPTARTNTSSAIAPRGRSASSPTTTSFTGTRPAPAGRS